MVNHTLCQYMNKDFGVWVEIKHPFPYRLFYRYYELEYQKHTYYDRINRLDGLFDWICRMCRKATG